MSGPRRVAVPEGLDGERLDAALARMFGLSRATAAELVTSGNVLVAGRPAAKSERVPAGEWLEVTLPPPPTSPSSFSVPLPERVPGLVIVAEDDDIVVVDKPAGVAAHPTPGWTGPTVLGGLLATGHAIASSGAAGSSPPAAPPSARASCTGWTRAPPGSWSWPRASPPTPR